MVLFFSVNKGGERTLFPVTDIITFDSVVEECTSKWPDLASDFVLKYNLGPHQNCILSSQKDFLNVCLIASSLKYDFIEVDVGVVNPTPPVQPVSVKKRRADTGSDLVEECLKMYSSFGEAGCSSGSGQNAEFEGSLAIPQYDVCHDIIKTPLLSDGWENAISGEGQLFRGGRREFKDELTKYSTKLGFEYNFAKNNIDYVSVECKTKATTQCSWLIRGKEDKVSGIFRIHRANMNHDCLGKLVSRKHGRLGPKMWGSLVLEQVRSKPHQKGTIMKDFIKQNFGVDVPYFRACRTVESARDHLFGTFQSSYDQLHWWGEAVMRRHPDSIVEVIADPVTNTFQKAFFAFDACVEGFQFCRPMLFVDACHMIGRWTGAILTATAKDGNNGLFPVAFAIVPKENFENWVWFLSKLKALVKHDKQIWYVSDRNTGLMSAFPAVYDKPVHFFCLFHLHQNLKGYYAGPWSNKHRKDMCHLFTECAYAPNEGTFQACLLKFRSLGGKLADKFLADLPFDKWAFAYSTHIQRFGEMTSNAAESFNSWIKVARTLPVTFMVDTIRSGIMRWFVERRKDANSWHSKLCSRRQDIWNYNVDISRSWFVHECPNGNYKVQSKVSVEVNIRSKTCSCGQWQIHGFPCSHAVAAILKGGYKIEEVTEPCFFTTQYNLSYEKNLDPIPDTDKFYCPSYKTPVRILPPPSQNKPGRPKEKRLKSYMEVPRRERSICLVCGVLSRHDPVTCNNNPSVDDVSEDSNT